MLTFSKISDAVQVVAPVYGIDKVYLFGSYARGDATEGSDCDLRIVGGDIPTLFALGGLYEDLTTSLGCNVDIVMTDSMSESFYALIKDEERLVYAKI